MKHIEDILARINDIDDLNDNAEMLNVLLQISLWSTNILNPTSEIAEITMQTKKKKDMFFDELKSRKGKISIDDSNNIISILNNNDTKKDSVIFMTGETGADIISDLLLGQMLLDRNICKNVLFCTKPYPHQVTGLTTADLFGIIDLLSDPKSSDVWAVRAFGTLMQQKFRVTEQMKVIQDTHFTRSHLPLLDIDSINNNDILRNTLSRTRLIISKNYENYSRIKFMKDNTIFSKTPIAAITSLDSDNGIIKLFT